MEKTEGVFGKEFSPQGIGVVKLWQQLKSEQNIAEQEKIAAKFAESLLELIEPQRAVHNYNPRGNDLVKLLLNGRGSEFYFASGSSGHRISFRDHVPDPTPGGLDDIESPDGEVGFMVYPDPGRSFGEDEFRNFVKHFGSFRVDLTRPLS
jgi:hypothetical protein